MAALDFPSAPTVGQYFVAGNGVTYQWNGTMWLPTGGTGALFIGLTPPSNPGAGQLWFNSDQARLYVYYNDGNTTQWVPSAPIPGTQAIPAVTMPGADPGCRTINLVGNLALAGGSTPTTPIVSTGAIGLANQKWRIGACISVNNNPGAWWYTDIGVIAGGVVGGATAIANANGYNTTAGATNNGYMENTVVLTAPTTFTMRGAGTSATAQGGHALASPTSITATRLT